MYQECIQREMFVNFLISLKIHGAWYDVAINSTIKSCNLYIRLGGVMDKALDVRIRGREFESRYGQDFFIL